MKTERRHELEQNLLIEKLGTTSEALRPYAGAILGFIVLILAGYLALTAYSAYRTTRDNEAWDEYQMALFENDAELKRLQRASTGGDYDGSDMHEWAYVTWADRQLRLAGMNYLRDRTIAMEKLTAIEAVYKNFADNAEDPEVKNRARLGLARVYEMQNKPQEAIDQYALVEDPLGEVAAVRIERLKSKKTQDDLKWLATAVLPKPVVPSGGRTPGTRPGLESILPPVDATNLDFGDGKSLEEIIGGIKPAEGEGRYEGVPGEQPATDGEKAPSETPAVEQPATSAPAETPATTETPAQETPTDGATPAATEESATTPATETPAEETPAEKTPVTETPATETPAAETPASEPSTEPAPSGEAPAAK